MQLRRAVTLAFSSRITAQSLTEALNANNDTLSTLNNLLAQNPDIVSSISNLQNITLLAPNNDGLKRVLADSGAAAELSAPGTLQAVLSYHVLDGNYTADKLQNTTFIKSMLKNETFTNVTGGQRVEAQPADNKVQFFSGLKNNSTVTKANIAFNGGTIHIIDNILTVPANVTDTLNNDKDTTSAAGAITSANLGDTVSSLKDITVFIPNNAAFEAIGNLVQKMSNDDLANILQYHVVQGKVAYSSTLSNTTVHSVSNKDLHVTVNDGKVFVNAARVLIPDILIENGVAHVIDQVLNPDDTNETPNPTATTAAAAFSGATSVGSAPFTSTATSTPATTSVPNATGKAASNEAALGVVALLGGFVFFLIA